MRSIRPVRLTRTWLAMTGQASTTVHADMSGATCPYSGAGASEAKECPSECKPSGAATTVAMAEGKH